MKSLPFIFALVLLTGLHIGPGARAESVDWDSVLQQARDLQSSNPQASLDLMENLLGPVDAPLQADATLPTVAKLLRLRTEILRDRGAYDLATLEALRFKQAVDDWDDPSEPAYARFLLGTLEAEQGRYGRAMDYFHAARRLLESTELFADQALVYNAIGMTHHFGGDLERARNHTEQAVALASQAGQNTLLAIYTGNLATIIASLEGPRAALPLQRQVLELGESLGAESISLLAEINICRLLVDAGELNQADEVCAETVERLLDRAPVRVQAGGLMTLADLHFALERHDQALEAYETALSLAAGAIPTVHREIVEKLAAFHEARGELRETIRRQHELIELRDTELERERQALVEELEIRFELERTAAEMDLLRLDAELKTSQIRLRNGLLLALGLVLLIMVFAALSMYRTNRLKTDLQNTLAIRNHELEEAFEQINELARVDPLTGLLNRRALEEMAVLEMARSRRMNKPITIAICDIDHFKPINDQFGHAVGDEVLTALAQRLRKNFRDSDLVARWGGEEFLCLLPQTAQPVTLAAIERLRSNLAAEPIETRIGPISLTLTWGVAEVSGELEEAILRADQALYAGKRAGRNRVEMDNGDELDQ